MPLTNLLKFTRCEESWRVPRTGFETIPVFGNSRRKCNANSPASIPAPACPLPSWLRLYESVGAPADVNTRISHLAECQSAALEHAPAAASAAAGRQCSATGPPRIGLRYFGQKTRWYLRVKTAPAFFL